MAEDTSTARTIYSTQLATAITEVLTSSLQVGPNANVESLAGRLLTAVEDVLTSTGPDLIEEAQPAFPTIEASANAAYSAPWLSSRYHAANSCQPMLDDTQLSALTFHANNGKTTYGGYGADYVAKGLQWLSSSRLAHSALTRLPASDRSALFVAWVLAATYYDVYASLSVYKARLDNSLNLLRKPYAGYDRAGVTQVKSLLRSAAKGGFMPGSFYLASASATEPNDSDQRLTLTDLFLSIPSMLMFDKPAILFVKETTEWLEQMFSEPNGYEPFLDTSLSPSSFMYPANAAIKFAGHSVSYYDNLTWFLKRLDEYKVRKACCK